MSLTRSFLNALGIESDKAEQIIQGHSEAVEALKAQRDEAKAEAEALRGEASKVAGLEQQVEALKAADKGDEWKAQYDELQEKLDKLQGEYDGLKGEKASLEGEFESYKQGVATEKLNSTKLELYKGLLREIGLDEKRVDKAARLKSLDELAVEDGKLSGYDELKKAEAEEWAEFIPQPQGIKGQDVPGAGGNPKPPQPAGDQPNERAVQIAKERHEKLYGKSEE